MAGRILLSLVICYLLTCFVVSASDLRNTITIHEGGYENILIAINKDVAEDQSIIDNLIDIFSSGSGHLFTATKRRAYWRNITILIPKTWTPKPEYEPAKTESFETANIIIDAANPEWDDNPYTLQLGGCGVHGEYIHLTPDYLTDRANSEYIWGSMGKLLTHEWGHLRWGLFDEYHTEGDGESVQKFYVNSFGDIVATRCSDQLEGEALNINTFAPCQRDPSTGLYEEDCFFFPNLEGQTSPASIMYAQFLDSVIGYCDSNDGPHFHNREAQNKHNKLCDGRSAWDVMLETEDFLEGNNPPIEEDIDTTPTFRLVQARERRVALVLDVSGSMGNNDRLTKLNQAATQYLRYTIDDGSFVGIAHFSDYSRTIAHLTEITDTSRESLVLGLPDIANGPTCIGCGILEGIEILKGVSGTDDPAGGYILLVSDGQQNRQPYIEDVFDEVDEAGVIIDTIAFSEAADPNLLELSVRTNGLAFFYPDTATSTALNDAFTATVSTRPGLSSETLPIQLYSGALTIPADGPIEDTFLIDSSLGVNTVLTFSWLDDPIDVVVIDPFGVIIDSNDTVQYNRDDTAQIIAVVINETAKTGLWRFSVDSESDDVQTVLVTIESKPTSQTDAPITVNAIVGSQTIDHTVTPRLEIFAEVRKGYLPVVNAGVQAVIESPGLATTYLPLFDNGAGADITKNDGIYSAYFLQFDNNGRYSIKVQVSNEDSTASISSRSRRSSGGLPLSPDRYTPSPAAYEPAEPFVRTGSGGVFEVENFVAPIGDELAPSRINDLGVLATSYDESSVTLQWTAVGDDYDQGTASFYDLRYATTFDSLRENFTTSDPIMDDQVIAGNLSMIGLSGTVESVVVKLPERGEKVVYFFGIVAVDEAGNEGDVSNLVSASLEYVAPMTTAIMTTTMEMSTTNKVEPKTGLEPWVIGVITAASVVFAFAVGLLVVMICKMSSSSKKKVDANYSGAVYNENATKSTSEHHNNAYVA
ncbi:calcium-activated chloride channel regulator 1-like isoform X1 [Lytechinus variegatus]|uniref:calcium-activated chloride channel regulator 1-like isoform X1 n=1 Tax=Lytechinus variegatus TaxID=7654 RepID=UPI001BB1C49A|nr:calcium-activated chloride channel regulator 1-like isoform X1 [Lytechinus variegatus]